MAMLGDQLIGFVRTPTAGAIEMWMSLRRLPGGDDGIDPLPRRIDFVAMQKQRVIVVDDIKQQTPIGIAAKQLAVLIEVQV